MMHKWLLILSFVTASSSESHASHPPQVQFLWLQCSPGDLAISDGWHPSRLTCSDVPHPTQRCFLLVNRDQYCNGFFHGYNLIWWINIGCPKIAKSMIPIPIIPGPSVLLFDPHSKTSMRSRWLNISRISSAAEIRCSPCCLMLFLYHKKRLWVVALIHFCWYPQPVWWYCDRSWLAKIPPFWWPPL